MDDVMTKEGLSFSKIRGFLFPIDNWELPKFIPMAVMIFVTVFNLTMLRNAKDALMVTAPCSGAETITFLKLYGVLPTTFVFSLLYVRLRKATNFITCYYAIVGMFIAFFILFVTYLYPNALNIQPDVEYIKSLQNMYPRFKYLFPIYGVWTYALFYVMSELWGALCLSILFWQMANDMIGPNEAKRFYPLLIFVSHTSVVLLSALMRSFCNCTGAQIIQYTVQIAIVLASILLVVFYYLHRYILVQPKFKQDILKQSRKPKVTLSFTESIRQAMHSPYVGLIAVLVLSYGVIINLIDVTWKSRLLAATGSLEAYYQYMSTFTFWLGIISMCFIYLSKGALMRFGWRFCAMTTPVIMLFTGLVFFVYLVIGGDLMAESSSLWPGTALVVMVGGFGLLFTKSAKYSFFDPTKEMSFIPLPYDLRIAGKAAVDGIGGRLGESSGGFIQSLLLIWTAGTQVDIAPYLLILTVVLSVVWLISVYRLNELYQEQLSIATKGDE